MSTPDTAGDGSETAAGDGETTAADEESATTAGGDTTTEGDATAGDSVAETNSEVCSVVRAVEEIGSQWRLIVLNGLQDGEHRFNELKRATGANSRTLSRVLDDLEAAGLVDRRVEDRPIATYYSLTPAGERLCPVFEELESWADEWLLAEAADADSETVDEGEGATADD